MARTKSTASRKHRKILKSTRGYKNAANRRLKVAKDAALHAGQYAYAGRRLKKRGLRNLWTIRLSAAVKEKGISYSRFINMLKKSKIEINRKILSEIAIHDEETFEQIVKKTGFQNSKN